MGNPRNWFIEFKKEFAVHGIYPKNSKDEYLIQMADIFVGLGVYSRGSFQIFNKWLEEKIGQIKLFETDKIIVSKGHKEAKCPLIHRFINECKRNGLKISLEKTKGFKTHDPKNSINFWWYTPQGEYDKAPIRRKR